jgi:tetratricopeptide (TPR) repeat protein
LSEFRQKLSVLSKDRASTTRTFWQTINNNISIGDFMKYVSHEVSHAKLTSAKLDHQRGNLKSAHALYSEYVAEEPDNPEAWHLLGCICLQLDESSRAELNIRRAIQLQPGQELFHHHLAVTLRSQQRFREAVKSHRKSLELNPSYSKALVEMGRTYECLGKIGKALKCYDGAIDQDPTDVYAWVQKSQLFLQLKSVNEARILLEEASQRFPESRHLSFMLGEALQKTGEARGAIKNYLKAVDDPIFSIEAHNNLGVCCQEIKSFKNAEAHYRRALKAEPQNQTYLQNLGSLLLVMGKTREAILIFEAEAERCPDSPRGWANLGIAYTDAKRFEASLACFKKSLELSPNSAYSEWNRASTRLVTGDFLEGFKDFERRYDCAATDLKRRSFPGKTLWDGAMSPEKTLLIYAEQGLGDSIQFARFLPMAEEVVGSVIFECQRSLVKLFEPLIKKGKVIAQGNPLPEFDLHSPLMSLAHLFRTNLDSVPDKSPYLIQPSISSLPALKHRHELQGQELKIGIAWAGNPNHRLDHRRSCPLEAFLPLRQRAEVKLFSLQVDINEGDRARLQHEGIVDTAPWVRDFNDTAALVLEMDLILSVDTSVAHLSGALNQKTWLLLPSIPDWRWMLDRSDSPWYPSMRLFRQKALNDWQGLLAEVYQCLAPLIESKKAQYSDMIRKKTIKFHG